MAEVKLRNVVKAYGTTEVIHGIDLGRIASRAP